jgi:hypothetical protein
MKTAFAYTSVTRPVACPKQSGEWRLLGIYYDDWRSVLKVDNRPVAIRQMDGVAIKLATNGAHFLHTAETGLGTPDVVGWTAFQFGRWGSQQHRAFSFDMETGF